MIKLLCPKCGKDSYSADTIYFSPCPYCGLRFSGQYGVDRRHKERLKKGIATILTHQGVPFEVVLTNSSYDGLGIEIFGETRVGVGEAVILDTNGLQVEAKVLWVTNLSDKCLVGLQKVL
jgi:hypothetical protein